MKISTEDRSSTKVENKDNNKDLNNFNYKEKKELLDIKRNLKYDEMSESIKLKDLANNNKENDNRAIKNDVPQEIMEEKINYEKNKILNLFNELEKRTILTNNTRKYGNSIPIGAFCNALSFIIFGIFKTGLLDDEYTNLWSVFALFGGLGQLTAGIMELIIGREFTSFIYIFYGIYCFTHYILRIVTDRFGNFDLCIFFIAWFLLSIPTIVYSLRTNLIYLLQTVFVSFYFLFRCIGEGINEDLLIDQLSGSFQIVSGLLSLYIFLSQIINKYIVNCYINTFPFDKNNKIDFPRIKQDNKLHNN